MTVAGNLKTMALDVLMQWCRNSGQTGILTFSRNSMKKEIYFEEGMIVSAASNDPREYLGQFLIALDKISEEQLRLAFEAQRKTKILLGRIFVARKMLTEEEVSAVLERKILEMLFNLFLWKEGTFQYGETTLVGGNKRVDVRVDPENCILECARRVDEWKRYRSVFPHDRLAVSRTEKEMPPFDKEPMKNKVLALALEGMTIEGMCLELRIYSFALLGTLYDLHRRGLVAASEGPADEEAPVRKVGTKQFTSSEEEVAWLYENAAPPETVPSLVMSLSALKELNLTSQEAFIVTRINGRWDVRTIVMICPIGEVETLRALKRFRDEKIITLA